MPDLLIFGVPDQYSGDILNSIVEQIINKTVSPKAGTMIQRAANFPVLLRAVDRSASDHFTLFALDFADRKNAVLDVLQVVYPDQNNLFPGQPGCDPKVTSSQDVVAFSTRQLETHPNGDEYRTHF